MCSKILLQALAASMLLAPSFAFAQATQDRTPRDEQVNTTDFEAVREFLKNRRVIEKGKEHPDLKITGDVRAEWRHMEESSRGLDLRTGKPIDEEAVVYEHEFRTPKFPISANDFDIEFNLRFDYATERTWAVGQIQFDNSAGVDDNELACDEDPIGFHGSGCCNRVCLRKAFVGYNIFDNGCSRLDFEIGRSSLYNAFDSRIQFDSRYDGFLIYYESKIPYMDRWYWQFGGFVVDERVNHFAWLTEIGFMNILDSGFDFKYSLIDWEKHGRNICRRRNPEGFKFINSQFTFAYRFHPEYVGKKTKLYGAFLINHLGQNARFAPHSKTIIRKNGKTIKVPAYTARAHHQNLGWYLGCLIGEIKGEGDWTFDACYQVVQAFAIPDGDVSGIGRGNVLDESVTGIGARGNTNYRGWRFEGLYALTDNFTIDSIIEFSKAYNKKIGGSHTYSKFELETIYAF